MRRHYLRNVGRTLPDVRNPGTRNFDLSLFKNFLFREDRLNTQVRVEAFNAMNTTQFNAPAPVVGNSNIGVISSAAAARQVQLTLKVIFWASFMCGTSRDAYSTALAQRRTPED